MTLPQDASPSAAEPPWVSAEIGSHGYRVTVQARGHTFTVDEPADVGGTDTGPTPYEYLLAALGSCTAITLRMYADRKGWPLERAEVLLRSARRHALDCESCETDEVGPKRLEREVLLEGPLTEEQRTRLLAIAERCPVKQTLERGVQVLASLPA